MALQRAFGGAHGAPAQHTARGLLELGDTRPRFVCDALRVGPRAGGRAELVGEVLGVLADALAKLRELGLQLNNGRAGDRRTGVRGLGVDWGTGALVEAV